MKFPPTLPLQQHPHFAGALRRLGRDVQTVQLEGAAPTQVIQRFGVRFVPRGPIWTNGTKAEDKALQLRRSPLRIINSEINDDVPHLAGFRALMTPAYVAELDLGGTAVNRLAAAKGKWRNGLRKSLNHKLTIKRTVFDANLHQWLLDADTNQQRAKRYRGLPHYLIHAYAAQSARDVIVFTAKLKHDVVAAMLFMQHFPVSTYHIGWTSDAGRIVSAHHRMLMHAADYFADQGLTRLDLGTVDTENAPGLARFKIGSGANVRPLGGTWLRLPGF